MHPIILTTVFGGVVLGATDASQHSPWTEDSFWREFMNTDQQVPASRHAPCVLYLDDDRVTAKVLWIPVIGFIDLVIDGERLDDLVTKEADTGRLGFTGRFDDEGVPEITGFVDFGPNDTMKVQIAIGFQSSRFVVGVDGTIEAASECKCPVSGGELCSVTDCDLGMVCKENDVGEDVLCVNEQRDLGYLNDTGR